jgi:HK97 family phage major capsid protein
MPSMRDDAPATILGKPVVINDDMADNNIIFGDLKTYKARLAKDFTVSVLKEALMEYLAIGVIGFGRADGKLANAGTDPVAILK